VIVQRLRLLLSDLISPMQSSLIPGRSTHDNILVAQEVRVLTKNLSFF